MNVQEKPATSAPGRFLINVISNLLYTVLNTGVMLWYVPYLVHGLGVAAYGMIPLANSVVLFTSLLTNSLNVSVSRYMAIDLNRGSSRESNVTFNTAFVLSLIAGFLLVLPISVVTLFFPSIFNVPAGLENATRMLFASVGFTTVAALISGSFGVSSVILSRFDLRNIVRALMLLSRIGVVIACFAIFRPSLYHVAAGLVIAAVVGLLGDVAVWRRLTPHLRIDLACLDRGRLRELVGVSVWTTVNLVGTLLLMDVDLFLVNKMFGAEMTGRYGSLLLFPMLVNTLTETVLTVLSPSILGRYAIHDIAGMKAIVVRSVRLVGLGLALPIGLLCGFAKPLLALWLGPQFADLHWLLALLVGHLTVNLSIRPLSYVITAYNRVKTQGLVTIGLGAANIILAVILVWCGWGVAGVAASMVLVWTLRNVAFMASYGARLMHLPWYAFYPCLFYGALGTLGVFLASFFITASAAPESWVGLAMMSAGVSVVYALLVARFGLNQSERDLIAGFLKRFGA